MINSRGTGGTPRGGTVGWGDVGLGVGVGDGVGVGVGVDVGSVWE
ncbi:MAG: hypothetical protein QW786_03215 [Candidatus Hadarchaeum sp.]